jgi:hypothetical protein
MTAVRLVLVSAVATLFAALAVATGAPDQAQAHRSRCHQAHTCPSDYRVAITPDCGSRDKTLARASNAGAQTFADSCGSDPPQ